MSFSSRSFVLCILAGLVLSTSSGCFLGKNAFLGFAAIPIPISPWLQDHYEDVAWEKERYGRSPILGPLTADGPDFGMDEPSDDQVFRKLVEIKRVEGNWPMLHEVQLNDVRIFKEKMRTTLIHLDTIPWLVPLSCIMCIGSAHSITVVRHAWAGRCHTRSRIKTPPK